MTVQRTARILPYVTVLCAVALTTGCSMVGLGDDDPMTKGNAVRFEHVALNVPEPIQMAQWYVDHLGMQILREGPAPINARFVADAEGAMMLELYTNPPDQIPDYAAMDPLLLHVAFMADDVAATRDRLIAAGAAAVGDVTVTPAGDTLAMLRDPWGLAIQFVQRAEPMLEDD